MATTAGDIYVRSGASGSFTSVQYVQGGWTTVPSASDMTGIYHDRLKDGQIIWVEHTEQLYVTRKFVAFSTPGYGGTDNSATFHTTNLGISGGGGPEASWIMNTNEPDKVDGFIYEAPTFNFIESVKVNGQARFPWLPISLFDYFIWLSEVRFGIDFDSMDYREAVINDDTPMLLFHGDDDEWIPVSLSYYIAEKRTTNIQYLRYENVGHVQAWNADPILYEKTLKDFLKSISD